MQTTHKDVKQILAERKWHLMDASSAVLGRLASRTAHLLIGKHKPSFSRHLDCGDFVVITNASKIRLTGNKAKQKGYFKHSGYPAGGKVVSIQKLIKERPQKIIELAVKRMLPKNKLGSQMFRRLKVYAAANHPHGSQNPQS